MNDLGMPFDDEVYEWVPQVHPKYYELHRLDVKFSNKVALISMICFLKRAYDKKGTKMTFIELIDKLTENTTETLKAELADICDAFYSEPYDFDNYGFKSAKEIKVEINRILFLELPF
jgi:hypothetical protein